MCVYIYIYICLLPCFPIAASSQRAASQSRAFPFVLPFYRFGITLAFLFHLLPASRF